jgi:glycosyltransferase involved in cell wall biosynthesis
MEIFIIANAYNRKNGANGSLIDLYKTILQLGYKTYFISCKRNFIIGIFEAVFNNIKLKNLLRSFRPLNYLLNKKNQDLVLFVTNIDIRLLSYIRTIQPNSKIVIFQTGNLPINIHQDLIFIKRLKIANFLFFQSPKHYLDFKNLYSYFNIFPYLTYATSSIEDINFKINKNKSINQIILYCAGSIQPRKNQIFLIKAFKKILENCNFSNCKLLFSGPLLSLEYPNYSNDFITLVNSSSKIYLILNIKHYHKIMYISDIII